MDSDETPIVSVQQRADYIAAGGERRDAFRIGTEHEKLLFDRRTLAPLLYHGKAGIGAVLQRLLDPHGEPIRDDGHPIGVRYADGAAISLELAGQLELSGAPNQSEYSLARYRDAWDGTSRVFSVDCFRTTGRRKIVRFSSTPRIY